LIKKIILEKLGTKDILYNIEEIDDIIYIYIRKSRFEKFDNPSTIVQKSRKRIIFVFTYDTIYLIEPLLKIDLSKKSQSYRLYIIIFIILILGLSIHYYIKLKKNRQNCLIITNELPRYYYMFPDIPVGENNLNEFLKIRNLMKFLKEEIIQSIIFRNSPNTDWGYKSLIKEDFKNY
jgi:hypothetical protein